MPPQAVTLEPLVQGERHVAVFRLLGRTEHAHQPQAQHSVGCKYRLRGLARWQTSQRNFIRYSLSLLP